MVRLSVVIPTYDRPDFLEGAIESAVGQTFDAIEVMVIDDGSNEDYASEVTSGFPDNVRAIRHDENRGLSAARNTGIENARGEYVAFLDDDDRWREDKLELQIEALETNPTAGIATCRLAAIDANGRLLRCDGKVVSGDISDEILTRNVIGSPSRVVVRRRAFSSERPFDEKLPTKQDWDLYIRLCQEWEVVGVNELLCYRTRHGGMSSDPEDAKTDNMRVIEKHRDLIERRGLWSKTMAEYNEKVGITYLLDGQRASARGFLRRALSGKPSATRFALVGLSLVPHGVFERVLGTKRWYERMSRDCESGFEWGTHSRK